MGILPAFRKQKDWKRQLVMSDGTQGERIKLLKVIHSVQIIANKRTLVLTNTRVDRCF